MSTLTLKRKRQETDAGVEQKASELNEPETNGDPLALPPGDAPTFDEKAPAGLVRGEPGVEYVQGENFFDANKTFLRKAPAAAQYLPLPEAPTRAEIAEIKTAKMIENPEVFDLDVPHALVRGEEGIEYVQGESYFDREFRFVKKAPRAAHYFVPTAEVSAVEKRERERRAAAFSIGKLANVPRVPTSIMDAEKENAKALAAEFNAE